jgi:ABC-type lipoprotein release transport system permease subunit
MAETTLTAPAATHAARGGGGVWLKLWAIAWRNLWRNRRRTWLTVSGIALAVWLLVFARSIQDGTFGTMVDMAARTLPGHVQVQHLDYQESPQMENTLRGGAIADALRQTGAFEFVNERAQGFALVSAGEKSFGAQVIGVEHAIESRWSTLAASAIDGRYIEGAGEAFIGEVLARNIGVAAGDEIVMLGTAREGGIAALALEVAGVFRSGVPDLDRSLMQVTIDDFREAWSLGPDESHAVVALGKSLEQGALALAAVGRGDPEHSYLDWRELMPDLEQQWEMKQVSTEFMFYIIAIIVGFSVVNTFMMLVFERTSEMGVLMAIGMKPGLLVVQLQIEALLVALTGVAVGTGLALLLIIPLAESGMPFPIEGMEEIMQGYALPDRLYPVFNPRALLIASGIMVLGTQIAALVPGLRIFRLHPVEAIRQET